MAVAVMKKTGKSKEKKKGKQVLVTGGGEEGNSSSSSMANTNCKGKQVHNFAPAPLPQLPPGFKFVPEDADLINDYLLKKVMGLPMDYNVVVERDLYADEEPAQICRALGKAEHEDFYVFTLVKSKHGGETGRHMSRRAGNGTWKGERKGRDCYDGMGRVIGCRTTFNFFQNMSKRTPWIMHQYTLPHQQQGWAICRIHNAKNKGAPQYPASSSTHPPLYDASAPSPAAKRQRTNHHTPSTSHPFTQTPLQSSPPLDWDNFDVDQLLLELSHDTTAADNVDLISPQPQQLNPYHHTPSSSQTTTQTPLQYPPSHQCHTALLPFLVLGDDDDADMDQLFLEISHATTADNAFNDLEPFLSLPPAAYSHVTLSESTDFGASSSSFHPQQDFTSSQPHGLNPYVCCNNNWCPSHTYR